MITPRLETERLLLRPFEIEDVQNVFEGWETDPDVARYMYWESHNDINKTIEWLNYEINKIDAPDWYRWAIVLKETGELIGTGVIHFDDSYSKYGIGYNLGKKYWGKGYTTEAMKEILTFVKENLEISEIIGCHANENPASGKVLEKLGFQYNKDIPYECGSGICKGKEYCLKL